MTATFEQLEQAYEQLAGAIDQVGRENEALFLAKLAVVLAHHIGDPAVFAGCIELAVQDVRQVPPSATLG